MRRLSMCARSCEDRYGEPPESVLHLLAAGEIRLTCERLGISQMERKRTAVEEKVAAKPTSQKRDVGHPGPYSVGRGLMTRQWNGGDCAAGAAGGAAWAGAADCVAAVFAACRAESRGDECDARGSRGCGAAAGEGSAGAGGQDEVDARHAVCDVSAIKLHAAPQEEGQGHQCRVADEAGGEECEERRAVYAAGRVEVAAIERAGGGCDSGDAGVAGGAGCRRVRQTCSVSSFEWVSYEWMRNANFE